MNSNVEIRPKGFLNKIVNLIFCIYLLSMPIIISLFRLIGVEVTFAGLLLIFLIAYLLYVVFSFLLRGSYTKFNFKKSFIKLLTSPLDLIITILFLSIIVSSSVKGVFNIYLFEVFSFFLIYLCFRTLDKKYYLLVLNLFVIIISICCFVGLLDSFFPALKLFRNDAFLPLSLQFYNPNHSAYVASIVMLLCVGLFEKFSTKKTKILYAMSFLIIGLFLFLNGSFAPETFLFLGIVILGIFFWIKDKKFPWKTFLFFVALILIAISIDIIPHLADYRVTTSANYFVEAISSFDNIFGTNLSSIFNTPGVVGADGWERSEIIESSKQQIASDYIFGSGAGTGNARRPHNEFIYVLLDFGIISAVCYMLLYVCLAIKFFKNFKRTNYISFILIVAVIMSCLCGLLYNITDHSTIYIYALAGILTKLLNNKGEMTVSKNIEENNEKIPDNVNNAKSDVK